MKETVPAVRHEPQEAPPEQATDLMMTADGHSTPTLAETISCATQITAKAALAVVTGHSMTGMAAPTVRDALTATAAIFIVRTTHAPNVATSVEVTIRISNVVIFIGVMTRVLTDVILAVATMLVPMGVISIAAAHVAIVTMTVTTVLTSIVTADILTATMTVVLSVAGLTMRARVETVPTSTVTAGLTAVTVTVSTPERGTGRGTTARVMVAGTVMPVSVAVSVVVTIAMATASRRNVNVVRALSKRSMYPRWPLQPNL